MLELVMHSIFLVLGLITVGCVLLITTKKNLQGLAIVENSGVLFDSFVSNNHDLDNIPGDYDTFPICYSHKLRVQFPQPYPFL